jgi:hypothetical protein
MACYRDGFTFYFFTSQLDGMPDGRKTYSGCTDRQMNPVYSILRLKFLEDATDSLESTKNSDAHPSPFQKSRKKKRDRISEVVSSGPRLGAYKHLVLCKDSARFL